MRLDECREAFHRDGSLRDLYIHDTTVEDWKAFVEFVRSRGFRTEYTEDGEEAALPERVESLLESPECTYNLAIDTGGLRLCCHFFTTKEIELDLVPNDVTSQAVLDGLLSFMSGVGKHLSQDVILTEENCPDAVWLRYSAADDRFRFQRVDL